MTTPAIFEKYPTVYDLAQTDFDTLFPFIKSISYPNNKTKHLINMANMVVNDFNGEIPMTVDELVKLPALAERLQMLLHLL
jgi:endonuclease-3